jgi:hypothetical protein
MQMSTIPMVALHPINLIEDAYATYEVSLVLNGVPGRVPHFIKKRHEDLEIPYEGLIV